MGPEIKPLSSQILCQVLNPLSHNRNSHGGSLIPPFPTGIWHKTQHLGAAPTPSPVCFPLHRPQDMPASVSSEAFSAHGPFPSCDQHMLGIARPALLTSHFHKHHSVCQSRPGPLKNGSVAQCQPPNCVLPVCDEIRRLLRV